MKREELERRALLFVLIIFLVFSILGGRLAYLQLVQGERWANLSQGQRIKKVEVTAPRGEILDSSDQVLAGNRPGFTVSLIYTGQTMSTNTINLLTRLLSEPSGNAGPAVGVAGDASVRRTGAGNTDQVTSVILHALDVLKTDPLRPVEIAVDVSPEVVTGLQEHMYELPGVILEIKPIRTYPYGDLAAHILGYVSSIDESQLSNDFLERYGLADVGYAGGDLVGQAGVESILAFDPVLRGTNGEKIVEVDARGRPVETDLGEVEPVPGKSLRLTIDADLQLVVQQALQKTITRIQEGLDPMDFDPRTGLPLPFGQPGATRKVAAGPNPQAQAGAAVVLDVRTGAVLAAASWPTFDPNWFALAPHLLPGTQQKEEWRDYYRQVSSTPGKPLVNRVLQGLYPPGSTYKPITALAALEAQRTIGRITCTGSWFRYGRTWGDWSVHGGGIGLLEALRDSCNVYFYQVGDRMGVEKADTQLVATAAKGDLVLRVQSIEGLIPGDYVYVGSGDKAELHEIEWVDRDTRVLELVPEGEEAGPIQNAWPAGAPVSEARNRWNNPTAWIAREFGLGTPTGIRGLPPNVEATGNVPDRRNSGEWWPGNTLNTVIGQGDNLFTPMQLAEYVATLANGGDRWVPYVVSDIISPDGTVETAYEPELAGHVRIDSQYLETVRRGMLAVTQQGGTAAWRFADWRRYSFPIQTAGKTGTAEAPGLAHGVYVGFAPYDNPEIAVVVVIEHGNGGSASAEPVARAIYDQYFNYEDFWESKQPPPKPTPPPGDSTLDTQYWAPPYDVYRH